MRKREVVALGLVASLAFTACSRGGSGGGSASGASTAPLTTSASLLSAVPGNGPRVVFDQQLTPGDPSPSPFPSDFWTQTDPATVTGLRLALPLVGQTNLENQLGQGINSIDGWGTFAPVMVRFDGPLDLATITSATVLVINIQQGSPHYGQAAALDLDALPDYPVALEHPSLLFTPVEPNANAPDLIFRPGNRVVFYEDETNTLILKPLVPLDEAAEHAVLLLTGVRGVSGDPVRPPAAAQILPGQSASVSRALSLLPALGVSSSQVSFAWTFTTQSITAVPLALADGLEGTGPFASLAQQYPPIFSAIDDLGIGLQDGDPYTLDTIFLSNVLGLLQPVATVLGAVAPQSGNWALLTQALSSGLYDLDSVKYIVTGSFESPSFIKGGGGRFQVSVPRSTVAQVPDQVTFLCCVPKPTAANGFKQPPYPCVIFGHGNDRSRLDCISIATVLARNGFATISIDAYGHGPDDALSHLAPEVAKICSGNATVTAAMDGAFTGLAALTGTIVNPFQPIAQVVNQATSAPIFTPFVREGRAIDVDGDGIPDCGKNFFNTDPTVTRDIMRQTALDTVQLCRIIKACAGGARLNGDFHLQGTSDIGGPNNPIYYVGQSLGSLIGAEVVALAPEVEAAVLNSAGSSLTEINVRSSYHLVTSILADVIFGVAVSGQLDPASGKIVVSLQSPGRYPTVATLAVAPGSAITLTDTVCSTSAVTTADASGQFFATVRCDRGDRLHLSIVAPGGATQGVDLAAPIYPIFGGGLGVVRNTPQCRRYLDVGGVALDGSDPVNFAAHWRNPLPGRAAKRVLLQDSRNDWTVPISTEVALARAAGFLSPQRDQLLRQLGITYGKAATTTNVDRDYGVESTQDYGFRIFCVDKHEFLNVPNDKVPNGIDFTIAAQEQMVEFLETGKIDDSFPILKQ